MEEFAELGLTKNELKVYECLIHFGKLGAGEISAKSGVPYGRVYEVLGSLTNKGFAKVIPENSKKFVPIDPKEILKIVEEKEANLSKLKEKVSNMKTFYESSNKEAVTIGIGKKGFYKILGELSEAKEYSYNIKWTSEYTEEKGRKRSANIKKGVDFKELVRYDKETERNVKAWMKSTKNIRKVENEGVAFSVSDNEEVLIGLIKSNQTILIRDKAFAKIMKKMFLETYKNAEEIR